MTNLLNLREGQLQFATEKACRIYLSSYLGLGGYLRVLSVETEVLAS